MTNSFNIGNKIEYPKEGILSKVIKSTNSFNVTLFTMAAGSEIEDHTSTKEGVIYVLEGDGIFTLESEKIKMLQGVLITMKKNAVHSLSANKNTCFLLILK